MGLENCTHPPSKVKENPPERAGGALECKRCGVLFLDRAEYDRARAAKKARKVKGQRIRGVPRMFVGYFSESIFLSNDYTFTPEAPGSDRGTFDVHSKVDVTQTALNAVIEYVEKHDVRDDDGNVLKLTWQAAPQEAAAH